MGRVTTRMIATTPDKFEEHKHKFDLTKIEGAEVFYGRNDELIIVMSEEWKDYLVGKSNVRPGETDAIVKRLQDKLSDT